MNVSVLSRKEKNTCIENQRSMKKDLLIFTRGVRMSRIIKPNNDVDCDECNYLKYESDIDTMICISKSGCVKC